MALFQSSVLKDHLLLQDVQQIELAYIKFPTLLAGNKERSTEKFSLVPQLTKKDEFKWMKLFEENKKKALELQREIDRTDREIDRMVYELYGLTEEEIGIVENSVN